MALHVDIEELLGKGVVEWDRIEFKKGWNPKEILQTICAFANDINDWGGGYLVVGVEAHEGVPIRPISGLNIHSLDRYQGELIQLCNQIQPAYFPIVQPVMVDDRHCLVIWVPGGDARPYSAPILGPDNRREYFIRNGSRTLVAKKLQLTHLMELDAKIPFDDRANPRATVHDLKTHLIRDYLQEVGSALLRESFDLPHLELCQRMRLVTGAPENLRPINAALLFFCDEPHRFFERAWIEVTIHVDDTGRQFTTQRFEGPIYKQLRASMDYLKTQVLRRVVRKASAQMEAQSYENWPFNALEEAIANAVFHKGYDQGSPIEVQVYGDRIEITNHPGAMPPVTTKGLNTGKATARNYRNRRIGDWLRDLRLTEGRATGVIMIHSAMASNGNPPPVFFTDKARTIFHLKLPIHPGALELARQLRRKAIREPDPDAGLIKEQRQILALLRKIPGLNATEIAGRLKKSKATAERHLRALREYKRIEFRGVPKTGGYHILD